MKYSYLLLLSLLIASCGRPCNEIVTCALPYGQVMMYSYGFTEKEMDTLVVQWYTPRSNFAQMIGEAQYHLSDTSTYGSATNAPHLVPADLALPIDSFNLPFDFLGSAGDTNLGNDILITIPAVNRSFKVTDINIDGNYQENISFDCGKTRPNCQRRVTSFKVDGVPVKNNTIAAVR